MAQITFNDPRAIAPFVSMAQNLLDLTDDDDRAEAFRAVIDGCNALDPEGPVDELVVELENRAELRAARDVLTDCLDNSAGLDPDADDFYDHGLLDEDVEISANDEDLDEEDED